MRFISILLPFILASCAPAFAAPLADVKGTGLLLQDPTGTKKVRVSAPSALAANYTLTLPVDDGTPGQLLSTNGSGLLSWVAAGGTGTVTSIVGGADVLTNPSTGIISTGTLSIGTLGVARGGTGLAAAIATGNFLMSNGSAYSAGSLAVGSNLLLTNAANLFTVSLGTASIAQGGTGRSTIVSAGNFLVNSGGAYVDGTIAAGSGITISQTAGTFTVTSTVSGVTSLSGGADVVLNPSTITGIGTISIGTLGVARGGTGRATIVSGGNFLVNSGGAYVDGTIAAGSGITISRSGGTFTIATSGGASSSGGFTIDTILVSGSYIIPSNVTSVLVAGCGGGGGGAGGGPIAGGVGAAGGKGGDAGEVKMAAITVTPNATMAVVIGTGGAAGAANGAGGNGQNSTFGGITFKGGHGALAVYDGAQVTMYALNARGGFGETQSNVAATNGDDSGYSVGGAAGTNGDVAGVGDGGAGGGGGSGLGVGGTGAAFKPVGVGGGGNSASGAVANTCGGGGGGGGHNSAGGGSGAGGVGGSGKIIVIY
jgi:hypothetical protein